MLLKRCRTLGELSVSLLELLLLSLGVAMDAFAVSVCKGLSVKILKARHALACGLWFGVFQFLMPLIGYLFASIFKGFIDQFDHWVVFVLLLLIGVNMIREALKDSEDEDLGSEFGPKAMFPLAVATSIDALAVGVSLAFANAPLIAATASMGVVTFLFAAAGVLIGRIFGARFRNKAEIAGGIVLILIGVKVLLEGLGILNF